MIGREGDFDLAIRGPLAAARFRNLAELPSLLVTLHAAPGRLRLTRSALTGVSCIARARAVCSSW